MEKFLERYLVVFIFKYSGLLYNLFGRGSREFLFWCIVKERSGISVCVFVGSLYVYKLGYFFSFGF